MSPKVGVLFTFAEVNHLYLSGSSMCVSCIRPCFTEFVVELSKVFNQLLRTFTFDGYVTFCFLIFGFLIFLTIMIVYTVRVGRVEKI